MGKVAVESPLVKSLFQCHLCHGLLRSATVIDECLHRFCKSCITDYFRTKTNCPICQITIDNPEQALKPDLTFQRLLYKIFPSIFQREIACKPSLLSSTTETTTRIYAETIIHIYLEYWDISADLFPNNDSNTSSPTLSTCYLECLAGTPLALIERFLRIKHSLASTLHIDLFYQTFLLNTDKERLIDVCYCFDKTTKTQSLDIRFIVSPYGYKAILDRIHQSKHPMPMVESSEQTPLRIEITEKESSPPTTTTSVDKNKTSEQEEEDIPPATCSSSSSNTSSIDPVLKVKLCRAQTSTKKQAGWYIPQTTTTTTPITLPDLVNSCKNMKKITKRKQPTTQTPSPTTKKQCTTSEFFRLGHVAQPIVTKLVEKRRSKPRRRTRFIPTMVKAPPSIFDRLPIEQYEYSDQDSGSGSDLLNTNLSTSVTTLRPPEMVIVNVEGNVSDPNEVRTFVPSMTTSNNVVEPIEIKPLSSSITSISQKTICKVPPYIPEAPVPTTTVLASPPKSSSSIIRPTPLYPPMTTGSGFSPIKRTLLPKKITSVISPPRSITLTSKIPSNDSSNSIPLDLSLK